MIRDERNVMSGYRYFVTNWLYSYGRLKLAKILSWERKSKVRRELVPTLGSCLLF